LRRDHEKDELGNNRQNRPVVNKDKSETGRGYRVAVQKGGAGLPMKWHSRKKRAGGGRGVVVDYTSLPSKKTWSGKCKETQHHGTHASKREGWKPYLPYT